MISVPPGHPQLPLDSALPLPILNTVVINPRVVMRSDEQSGLQTLFVGGIPFFVLHRDDEHSKRYLCVQLRLQGLAQQLELAAAFGHDRITQYRWEKKFEEEGLAGLAPYRPEGRPVSLPESIEETVVKLHETGLGMRRISSQLGLTLGVVRGVYERRGLEAHSRGEQASLYGLDSSVRLRPRSSLAARPRSPRRTTIWRRRKTGLRASGRGCSSRSIAARRGWRTAGCCWRCLCWLGSG